MIPIHELLSRLRWDRKFRSGRIRVGYLDKVAGRLCFVALQQMRPDSDNPALLDFVDGDGVEHSIPLHRIREVQRDGEVIWRRQVPRPPTAGSK